MLLNGLIIILIPFLGTSLGSAVVLFSKGELNQKLQKFLLGFASGVMIAASIWSLLIPSIEMAESQDIVAWIPATVGFLLGIGFLLLLDSVIPHMHLDSDNPEGVRSSLSKNTMLVLAVTLHNIPEGMAVGVTFVGAISDNTGITVAGALDLAVGIAIQNFPEGVVEPIGAVLTVIFAGIAVPLLPYLLSFAAGAMIYVVTEELIPESQNGKHSNIGTIGVAIGFTLMMVLDVALG